MIIKVPATSANLGPGYDAMGMSLNLYNEFTFVKTDEKIDYKDSLVYRAFSYIFDLERRTPPQVKISIKTGVPIARGLGSSATCIVAGLYASNIILGEKYSKDEILRFATDIEGHPDNVGPAILGGLVISAMEKDRVFYYKINPSKKLSYILIIPDFELETSLARSILPKEVTREDAVYNIARSNLISRAIEKGDMEMLIGIFGDRLHEPYRKKLIKDFDLYEKIARENKSTIFISGAGSSMLIISSKENLEILNKLSIINENYKIMELSSGGGAEIIGKDF